MDGSFGLTNSCRQGFFEKKREEEEKKDAMRAEIEEIAQKRLSSERGEKEEEIKEIRSVKRKEREEEKDQAGSDKKLKALLPLLSSSIPPSTRQGEPSSAKRKLEKEPEEGCRRDPVVQKKRKTETVPTLNRELEQLFFLCKQSGPVELKEACRRVIQALALHISQADSKKERLDWRGLSEALKAAEGALRQKGLSFFDKGSEISFPCFYIGKEGKREPVGLHLDVLKAFLVAPSLLKSALSFPVGRPLEEGSFLFDLSGLDKKSRLYIKALIFLIEHRREKLSTLRPLLDLKEFFRFCKPFQSPLLQRRLIEELSSKAPASVELSASETEEEKGSIEKQTRYLLKMLTRFEKGEVSEAQLLQAAEQFILVVCRSDAERSSLKTDRETNLGSLLEALRKLALFMEKHPRFANGSFLRLPCSYQMEDCQEQLFDFELAVPQLLLNSGFFERLLKNLPEGELGKRPHLELEGSSLKDLAQSRRFLLGIKEETRRQELLEKGEEALDSLTDGERGRLEALKRAEYEQLERFLREIGSFMQDPKSLDQRPIEDLCALYDLSKYYVTPWLSMKIFKSLSRREKTCLGDVKMLLETIFAHPGSNRDALMLLSENFWITGVRLFKKPNSAWRGVELGYFTRHSEPLEMIQFLKKRNKLSLLEEFFKRGEAVALEIFSSLPVELQRLFWDELSKNGNLKELSISPSQVMIEGEHPKNLKRLEWLINSPLESRSYDQILKKREQVIFKIVSSIPVESQRSFLGEFVEVQDNPEKLEKLLESFVKKGIYQEAVWKGWVGKEGEVSCLLSRRNSAQRSTSPQLERISKFLGVSPRDCSIICGKEFFQALIREDDLYRSLSGKENLYLSDLARVRREAKEIRPIKVKHLVIADYESNWLRLIPYYIDMQAIETFSICKTGEPFSSRSCVELKERMPHLKKLFLSGVKTSAQSFVRSNLEQLEELDLSGVERKWGRWGVLDLLQGYPKLKLCRFRTGAEGARTLRLIQDGSYYERVESKERFPMNPEDCKRLSDRIESIEEKKEDGGVFYFVLKLKDVLNKT